MVTVIGSFWCCLSLAVPMNFTELVPVCGLYMCVCVCVLKFLQSGSLWLFAILRQWELIIHVGDPPPKVYPGSTYMHSNLSPDIIVLSSVLCGHPTSLQTCFMLGGSGRLLLLLIDCWCADIMCRSNIAHWIHSLYSNAPSAVPPMSTGNGNCTWFDSPVIHFEIEHCFFTSLSEISLFKYLQFSRYAPNKMRCRFLFN